ncbi:MAG: hypothetical protein RMY00_19570 [Nostoc sp. ChiVER01]|nr:MULTISPECIES: hypothetical protein [unclassified Nostoc]MDZ8120600.1 hypothetical protein [Nostoc sp. CmiVER01]MDZ8225155.1 hypothetical protein [Nostoc sp. ChiVER01]
MFEELYERGLQLATKSKKKMKNRLVKHSKFYIDFINSF